MYILARRVSNTKEYFTYDERGEKDWTSRRLDAARFEHAGDARQCGLDLILDGAKIVDVGRDGETVAYKGQEIQIYRRSGSWRFRIGVFRGGKYDFQYGRKGMSTPGRALAYGRRCVRQLTT